MITRKKINKLPKAREKAGDRVVICLGFLIGQEGGVFWPITGRSKAETERFRITFDTQPKISPIVISPWYLSQLTHIVLLYFQVLFYSIPLGFDSVYLLH